MFDDQIIPQYKLLMMYDIKGQDLDGYYKYVLGEFVPSVQELGIYMTEAWHTAYGPYPIRLLEFVAENYETIEEALESEEFLTLESKLMEFVTNYSRRVTEFRKGFQF